MQTADCRLPTVDCGLETLQTGDWRLETGNPPEPRLGNVYCRMQIADRTPLPCPHALTPPSSAKSLNSMGSWSLCLCVVFSVSRVCPIKSNVHRCRIGRSAVWLRPASYQSKGSAVTSRPKRLLRHAERAKDDPGRTRTCNLWFRRPTPYPLGHRANEVTAACSFLHARVADCASSSTHQRPPVQPR